MPSHAGNPTNEAVQTDWLVIFDETPTQVRAAVQDIVGQHKSSMADAFYTRMLQDAEAKVFLSHEAVHEHLHGSMQRWLDTVFSCATPEQFLTMMAMQRHVGEVHARVDLPVNLVARGARVLKGEIAHHLAQSGLSRAQLVDALLYVNSLIDLAFEVMSSAYIASHERTARIDEAYRAFSSGQNMSLERERQRASLLDWENRYLQATMTGQAGDALPPLGNSSFGLWMLHKTAAFQGAAELGAIRELMGAIDDNLLPLCAGQLGGNDLGESRRLMKEVQAALDEVKFLLDSMFEHLIGMESGKDALTQLFNRRFLPAIMTREVEIARTQDKSFALLLIDVDHFKQINDEHGHAAGDRVLQQVAILLQNSVRSGDFVFRYGGEEFLLLLVEVEPHQAMRMAEKIRRRVAEDQVPIPNGRQLQVTVSIGVAMYDGHPDYQRLVAQADEALYRAKNEGRNRCVGVG